MDKIKYFDNYKHLNEEWAPSPFNIEDVAKWAVKQNYGAHRMVCALARALRLRNKDSKLAKALFEAANEYTY